MSESLPTIGIVTVEASRNTVNTHDSNANPPSSATMRGAAVVTMVESRTVMNMVTISTPIRVSFWRSVMLAPMGVHVCDAIG